MEEVYSDIQHAVAAAAWQNFSIDCDRGLCKLSDWKTDKSIYEEEARHLLETSGENYTPPDVTRLPLIKYVAAK